MARVPVVHLDSLRAPAENRSVLPNPDLVSAHDPSVIGRLTSP